MRRSFLILLRLSFYNSYHALFKSKIIVIQIDQQKALAKRDSRFRINFSTHGLRKSNLLNFFTIKLDLISGFTRHPLQKLKNGFPIEAAEWRRCLNPGPFIAV